MAIYVGGAIFGALLIAVFVISCLLSVIKACRDRRKIKKRIAARRSESGALPCPVTSSTSADTVAPARSASEYGDLGSPDIFNYRRSSYGSNVLIKTIGDDHNSISSQQPSVVSLDYSMKTENFLKPEYARGRRCVSNPMSDSKYYQRRRSYEAAMDNPSGMMFFPEQYQRRLTDPHPWVNRGPKASRYVVAKSAHPDETPNCHEMNGRKGRENKAFVKIEETERL